jgi:hypothetical protein
VIVPSAIAEWVVPDASSCAPVPIIGIAPPPLPFLSPAYPPMMPFESELYSALLLISRQPSVPVSSAFLSAKSIDYWKKMVLQSVFLD